MSHSVSHSSSRARSLLRALRPLWVGLAVLVLAVTLVAALLPQRVEASSNASLDQQLEEVREELSDVRANLKKAAAAREAALDDLAGLDQSLNYAQKAYNTAHSAYSKAAAHLAELQAELDAVLARLEANQQELDKTVDDLTAQQETLCDRMVNLYKAGGPMGYMALLMGDEDDSLVDLMERFRLLATIADQDAVLVAQIKALKEEIVVKRQALEEERVKVASLESSQLAVTSELQTADKECQAALNELEAARAAKKAVLASIEKDQAVWTRQEDQLLADSGRIEAMLKSTQSSTPVKPGAGVLSRPVPGPITSSYGYRIHPIFKVRKLHTGVDFQAATGDPIKAAALGTVIFAGWRGGYGKCTIIDHGEGLATLYAHQSTILVSVGQVVKRGAVIGKVGSTGYSTGPHLHFEVRVNGSPVDPMGYL